MVECSGSLSPAKTAWPWKIRFSVMGHHIHFRHHRIVLQIGHNRNYDAAAMHVFLLPSCQSDPIQAACNPSFFFFSGLYTTRSKPSWIFVLKKNWVIQPTSWPKPKQKIKNPTCSSLHCTTLFVINYISPCCHHRYHLWVVQPPPSPSSSHHSTWFVLFSSATH